MDPNGEGYRPEEISDGPKYPELSRPLSRDEAQVSRDSGFVGQDYVEGEQPGQNLPEEDKIEQVH